MEEYKKIIIDVIEKYDKRGVGRKNKYPNDFYLNYIFRIFFYGEHWNTFYCPHCDRSTIRKKFYKWKKIGIFNETHNVMFSKYSKNRTFKELFIDSTSKQNMNCSDKRVTFGAQKFKGKKQVKISTICDNNGIILSHIISNPKPHDNQYIKPLIKNLTINLKKHPVLAGDKGYISKQKIYKKVGHRLKLIVPIKKNQKKQIHSNKTLKVLKKRYKVEHSFCHFSKTYKRLRLLEDRNLDNYETFFKMAITCQIIRKIPKK